MPHYSYLKYYLLLIGFFSSLAYAHPHSLITLKTEFYVQDNQLTQLHFTWAMDELTSSYLKLEYQQNPKQTLDDLMNNIAENQLFSELSVSSTAKTQQIPLILLNDKATMSFTDNKASINFWVQLSHPISLSNHQIELLTYEKTFYVDMYYELDSDVTINDQNCNIVIDKPTPDDNTLSYAQSLDQDQAPLETDDFILGKLFAQKVVLTCK